MNFNMIVTQLLLFSISSIVLAAIGLVLFTYVRCRLALSRFKKQSNGLPLVADSSRSWLANHALWPTSKQMCQDFLRVFEEQKEFKTVGLMYGQRFGAFTIDLNLIKKFIYDEPNQHINRVVADLPSREYEASIIVARDDKWRRLRRNLAPALKPTKFKTPNVMHEIECSIDKLISHINRKLDEAKQGFVLDDLVHKYVLNLIFNCFYKQHNLIDFNDPNCKWTRMVEAAGVDSLQTSLFVRLALLFPQLKSTIEWLSRHFHAQAPWYCAMRHFVKLQTKMRLEARRQVQELGLDDHDNLVLRDGTKFRRNMIDTLIDNFLDGKLSKDEYQDNACFLLGTADNSTTECLIHTLYQLGVHQDLQTRLRKAVRTEGPEAEYLTWVLNESLRLLPPAPIGCSRTVTRDFQLDNGHVVPANTFVLCCAHTIHRLKEYWGEDAEEFKPDRWRDTSHHHPMQYIPFGAGARVCPGKEFALFEMKLMLAALLKRYKFICEPKDDIQQFNSPFLIFLIPNSSTSITIKRLDDEE